MEGDKYRYFISGGSIGLNNNSRNVLASENLKSDGNLRVGSADWSRSPWKSAHSDVIMWTNPLGPQVHDVTIHVYKYSERTAVDRTRRTRRWAIIEEKWKKRMHARKHVATWIGTWFNLASCIGIFLLASVYTRLCDPVGTLSWRSQASHRSPPIYVRLWSQTRWGRSDFSSINSRDREKYKDLMWKKSYQRVKIIFLEEKRGRNFRQRLMIPIIFAKYTMYDDIRNEFEIKNIKKKYFPYYFFSK